MNAAALCFHCGEPLGGSKLTAAVRGRAEPVCCAGCLAVAELIDAEGLADFYRYRTGPIDKPETDESWSVFADREASQRFVKETDGRMTANLLVDGLRCTACSWLIDKSLRNLPGIGEVSINAATGRARVEWSAPSGLADVLRVVSRLGFRAHPVDDAVVARLQRDERRESLKRLAVSGFGMMQVMMFAVGVYSAQLNHETMDQAVLHYFRLVSLIVATPVFFYAGWPFLRNALYSLRARALGLDVPVAIALTLAFAASAWNTFRDSGEVYFDSVAMFIFFLTLGRFVEMSVRHRTTSVADALARHLPTTAHRVEGARIVDIPTAAIAVNDLILVRAGEIVPADGVIIEGRTRVDEAFLTGESLPVERSEGAHIIAGALNGDGPIRVRITAAGEKTVLSNIGSLLQRAQTQKPAAARTADIAAARFLKYVLVGSIIVCGAWLAVDPSRAFSATLAVLIAACPCAFSIAMPATLAAATARLARLGMLVVHVDAIESLAKIRHGIFDKTGTLTRGELRINRCRTYGSLVDAEALAIAAALERASEHAVARAFEGVRTQLQAEQVRVEPGRGVEGVVEGHRYRIGSLAFIAGFSDHDLLGAVDVDPSATLIALGDEHALLATFELTDILRNGGATVSKALRDLDIESEILSGDSGGAVARVARECGIETFASRQMPADKLAHVQQLQRSGQSVLVLGDGVNDAPVLGAAGVSIAMGRGAALAHASADIVFVEENLDVLPAAILIARRAVRIARQNLAWSAVYNLTALPLAALGYIPPWIAAIGMSLSSMAVVLNAARLLRQPRNRAAKPSAPSTQPQTSPMATKVLSTGVL